MTAAAILRDLESKGFKLAIAESLTGGALSADFVSVAGASKVFLGSIVAYQTSLKHELLGVSRALLENQGAVDPEVAAQMATGVRTKLANKTNTDESLVVGIATTGVAGPDVQAGIAVGTVYIAISGPGGMGDSVYAFEFPGDRQDIRKATVEQALKVLTEALGNA
jgi:nicotinamide-nucleotide amidase